MRRPLLLLLLASITACSRPAPVLPGAGQASHAASAGDVAYYTCPMHPSIQQPGPGSCPICGMTLTPVTQAELATGAVRVDAARRTQFGIELEAAAVRHMGASLRIPGVVGWDVDRLVDVSVRVAGWVKAVRGAPGEEVRAGQTLFTLYSPELVAAQEDLLRATDQAASGDASAGVRRDAARLRLSRWGVPATQIDEIVRGGLAVDDLPVRATRSGAVLTRTLVEGGMVSPGQTLYRLGDLAKVWVEGAIPEDRVGDVSPGQSVTVSTVGGGDPLQGRVERILPEVDPTTRTARLRVTVDNTLGVLRPDQWATIEVDVDGGEHLAVPESAVLYTGPRRLVFVDTGGDLLSPREVTTGMKSEGYVQVLDGLQAGDRVVRSGNFLVAADSRLKQGGETGGHKHGAGGAEGAAPPSDEHAGHDMKQMEGR